MVSDSFNKITVEKQITGGNNVGDIVTTTLTIKFPNNAQKNTNYILTDVIPTGMRYTGYERKYNSNYYLIDKELQKLEFKVFNENNRDITIIYYSRNLLPGEFLIDSAVIQNPLENTKGYSAKNSYIISGM